MTEESYKDAGFSVLLFDDKKFLIRGLQRFLNPVIDCHVTTNYDEALKICEEKNVQILVADHQMPDNEGVKLLEHVRENCTHIRRIMTTSIRHEDLSLSTIAENLAHAIVYTPIDKNALKKSVLDQAKHALRI